MAAFMTRNLRSLISTNIKSLSLLPRNLNFSSTLNKETGKELTTPEEENDVLYRQIELETRGHDPEVLKSYEYFAVRAAKNLGIHFEKSWEPPKHLERYTLLKSVHIFKKHRVQYEMRTYFKIMQFKYLTGSTADTYLEYVERNLPEGVALKVTKYACETLPESFNVSL